MLCECSVDAFECWQAVARSLARSPEKRRELSSRSTSLGRDSRGAVTAEGTRAGTTNGEETDREGVHTRARGRRRVSCRCGRVTSKARPRTMTALAGMSRFRLRPGQKALYSSITAPWLILDYIDYEFADSDSGETLPIKRWEASKSVTSQIRNRPESEFTVPDRGRLWWFVPVEWFHRSGIVCR
jgi:hypothetical protein